MLMKKTRQTNKFSALMSTWKDSMNLATEATNTQGNALKNQEKYNESYVGQLQSIKTQMDTFWVNFWNSDLTHDILDFIDRLIQGFNDLADAITPLGALFTAVMGTIATASVGKFLLGKGGGRARKHDSSACSHKKVNYPPSLINFLMIMSNHEVCSQ